MFNPIKVPADSKMLYNVVKLKPGVTMDDVELTVGQMCNVVKNTYPGFIAGQVLKFAGFISDEGSVNSVKKTDDHIAIITYWESFEEHEESHSNELFKAHFEELVEMSDEAYEIGYEIIWQGEKEE